MLLISGDHIFSSKVFNYQMLPSHSLYPLFLYHIWLLYNARCASFSIELAQIFNRIVCTVFLMMYLYTEELHTICKLWNSFFFTLQNLQITKTSTHTKQCLHRRDVRGDAMTPERVLARNSNYVEKSVIFWYLG